MMFERRKHAQSLTEILLYQKLLYFINLRTQASEAFVEPGKEVTNGSKNLIASRK